MLPRSEVRYARGSFNYSAGAADGSAYRDNFKLEQMPAEAEEIPAVEAAEDEPVTEEHPAEEAALAEEAENGTACHGKGSTHKEVKAPEQRLDSVYGKAAQPVENYGDAVHSGKGDKIGNEDKAALNSQLIKGFAERNLALAGSLH